MNGEPKTDTSKFDHELNGELSDEALDRATASSVTNFFTAGITKSGISE